MMINKNAETDIEGPDLTAKDLADFLRSIPDDATIEIIRHGSPFAGKIEAFTLRAEWKENIPLSPRPTMKRNPA